MEKPVPVKTVPFLRGSLPGRGGWFPASALLGLMAWLAVPVLMLAEEISLRGHLGPAAPAWLEEFRFALELNQAQRQQVVVYSMTMKSNHVRQLQARKLPWVSGTASADADWVVGYSKGWWGRLPIPPQPIYGFQITDPESAGPKQKVVLAGCNHAREDPACWTLHGLIDFLVSDEPQARELRRGFEFLVYPALNPDGKLYLESPEHRGMREFRGTNGNPEISAAGESNHNRLWLSRGRFTSIDVAKAAMLRDTAGGRVDYLLDFHGIPASSFAFVDQAAATSPLGRLLRGRGLNLRRSEEEAKVATLRSWAASPEGLNAVAAFTPELSNEPLLDMLARGRDIALAFHDVLNGKPPVHRQPAPAETVDQRPPKPRFAWPYPQGGAPEDQAQTQFVQDGPFASAGGAAIELRGSGAFARFAADDAWDHFEDLTVSLWFRGDAEHKQHRYLVSRYQSKQDQRSWALFQMANSRDLQITISADGSHDREQIKRLLTTAWPEMDAVSPKWRHVAFTFAGGGEGRLRLFLDGVEARVGLDAHRFDDSPVPRLHRSGLPLVLGAIDGAGNAFEGGISEVGLWDRALPPECLLWLSRHSLRELD